MGDLHRRGTEGVAWLSCSHVFHVECIGAFERFKLAHAPPPEDAPASAAAAAGTRRAAPAPSPCSCPVCRAQYTRTGLDLD